jgi:hypothetical protein
MRLVATFVISEISFWKNFVLKMGIAKEGTTEQEWIFNIE